MSLSSKTAIVTGGNSGIGQAIVLELARQGAGFLVVLVPDDEATRRAVRVTKPLGLKFAEKYNRLTLEELA